MTPILSIPGGGCAGTALLDAVEGGGPLGGGLAGPRAEGPGSTKIRPWGGTKPERNTGGT